jgi:hypothetical protein
MALSPFAHYLTLAGKMVFFKNIDSTEVKAQVPGVEIPVPVELPQQYAIEKSSLVSTATKVQQLLRNVHLQPVYRSNKVEFIPIPPEGKTWEKAAEVSYDAQIPWIGRLDGKISFVREGGVTTWNWVSGVEKREPVENFKVTALAEDENGHLIVGSDQGKLRCANGEAFDTGKCQPVTTIVCLKHSHCFVQVKDGFAFIIDIASRKILKEFSALRDCCVLENEVVVVLVRSIIMTYKFDLNTQEYEECDYVYQNVKAIQQISPAKFMVFDEWTTVDILEKEHLKKGHVESYNNTGIYTDLRGLVCSVDANTVCVKPNDRRAGRGNCYVSFFSKGRFTHGEHAGSWGIGPLTPLSDGSVAYTTGTGGAGIHVANSQGKIVFSERVATFIGKDEEVSLIELVDGSIAAKAYSKLFVLKSRISESQSTDYRSEKETLERRQKIETCKLEIKYDPNNTALYGQLAELQRQDENQHYQTILLQLQAAIRTSQLYQARRLYKNARKLEPAEREPCDIFLSFLQNSAHQQLAHRVQLDLFAITKNPEDLPAQTKLTKRLLIGEGDFSYTEALLNQHQQSHPQLGSALVATGYGPIMPSALARCQALEQRGVKVLQGIDGCKIDEVFKEKPFKRIQWNCPFGGKSSSEREAFKAVIPQFFKSCAAMQEKGDRVHVTLVQAKDSDYWKERQKESSIVLGSTSTKYRLIRKRRFDTNRYPGYTHTKSDGTPCNLGDEKREFVFENIGSMDVEKDPQKKEYTIGYNPPESAQAEKLEDAYFECSTDEDSSVYYDSDEEETKKS